MKRDRQAKVVKSQSLMPPIAMLGTLVRACAGLQERLRCLLTLPLLGPLL